MPEFQVIQREFTRYIRSRDGHGLPAGVSPRRAELYRNLLFANIQAFLTAGFPVLKRILGADRWLELIRDFYASHPCRTPLFAEISEEFLEFLQGSQALRPDDPPFLLELAHYEWVELALSIAHDETRPLLAGTLLGGDPAALKLSLSSLAWPLGYRFPVHRIAPDFQPTEPSDTSTFLLVYRDLRDAVQFTEINAATFGLLGALDCAEGIQFSELVDAVCANALPGSRFGIERSLLATLTALQTRGVICGWHEP